MFKVKRLSSWRQGILNTSIYVYYGSHLKLVLIIAPLAQSLKNNIDFWKNQWVKFYCFKKWIVLIERLETKTRNLKLSGSSCSFKKSMAGNLW